MYQSNFEIVLRIVYIRLQRIKQKIQHDEEINIEVDEIPKFFEKKFEELVRYSRSDISKANHAKNYATRYGKWQYNIWGRWSIK